MSQRQGRQAPQDERQSRDDTLQRQRARRASRRRIDYYPSREAAALIDSQLTGIVGGDLSGVINRIVSEWAAMVFPE